MRWPWKRKKTCGERLSAIWAEKISVPPTILTQFRDPWREDVERRLEVLEAGPLNEVEGDREAVITVALVLAAVGIGLGLVGVTLGVWALIKL